MSDDPGLAAAGASQNEHRPANCLNCFSLGRIKFGENIHHLDYNISEVADTKPIDSEYRLDFDFIIGYTPQ